MRVFAYCAKSFEDATRKAAGVEPFACPPLDSGSVPFFEMEKSDLIYFDLHGAPAETVWFGDYGIVAITASQIRELKLAGAVVFALNCFLGDQNSPMLDALLDAGAAYVIGGDGENYSGTSSPSYGAGLLGLWFRRIFAMGIDPLKALQLAKQRLKFDYPQNMEIYQANRDALQFRAFVRNKETV